MAPAETTFVALAWLVLGVALSGVAVGAIWGLMRGAEAAIDLADRIGRRLRAAARTWRERHTCAGCARLRAEWKVRYAA